MDIDPRGPRFAAALTTIVLIAALATASAWLVAAQAVVFGIGAVFGMRAAPYGVIYRLALAPRLGPPREREREAPPRFAQGVGLVFAATGAAGYAAGLAPLGIAATCAALAAAFLNAAFGLCLGCELYVLIRRIVPGRQVTGAGQT